MVLLGIDFFSIYDITSCVHFLQVESTVEYICRREGNGAILVFLTGWDDISKLLDKVKANNYLGDSGKFLVLPLHGSMPTINQREIFDSPPPGKRQV